MDKKIYAPLPYRLNDTPLESDVSDFRRLLSIHGQEEFISLGLAAREFSMIQNGLSKLLLAPTDTYQN